MGAQNNVYAISRLDEFPEITDSRTGRITDDQTCGQVDHVDVVTYHFLWRILNVAPRASVTGRVSHEGQLFVMVTAECPFLLLQRSKTFAPGATMIAMADNNADLHLLLFVHDDPLVHLIDLLHRHFLVFHA
jgi:hypothetical protein